jgi:hypothetical protein
MRMNRILKSLLLIASFLATTMCNAQVQISTKQLDNTQWEIVLRTIMGKEEIPNRVNTWDFNMSSYSSSMYLPTLKKTSIWLFQYYVSDIEPCDYSFDKSNVGVNYEGKYIVVYNKKTDEVDYYTVMSFTDDEMVLFRKAKKEQVPNLDVYITFKRVNDM